VKQNKWCEGKEDEESEQVCVRVNRDNVFCFPFGVKFLKLMVCIPFLFPLCMMHNYVGRDKCKCL
jgi:hypothetical protein